MSKFRSSAPMLVALLALFIALGGGSFVADATARAARLITGKDIKDSSLTTADVMDRSLRAIDFKKGQLPAGPRGPRGPQGDRAQVIGADVTGSIHGDAGAVAAHSCTTADLSVVGAQVGDVPVLAFVGATPAPPGLSFQVLKISAPDHGNLRFCNPTDAPSPAFSDVGVRIIMLR